MIDVTLVSTDDERRLAVAAPGSTHNGIDYLEVDPTNRRVLLVHFFHPLPGQPDGVPAAPVLTEDNVRVEGGARITGIRVLTVRADAEVLRVGTDQVGDFSPYLLRLVSGPEDDRTPDGFDLRLASAEFSYRVDCPAPGDCRPPAPGEPSPAPSRCWTTWSRTTTGSAG